MLAGPAGWAQGQACHGRAPALRVTTAQRALEMPGNGSGRLSHCILPSIPHWWFPCQQPWKEEGLQQLPVPDQPLGNCPLLATSFRTAAHL